VERFGSDVLISYKEESARDRLAGELEAWSGAVGYAPRRIFGKFIPRQNAERIAPALLRGDAAAPLTQVVQENGVRYSVDFEAGYSAGLFIDQRRNRLFLRQRRPKRVLNTFAYTCSFSLVAALDGAETYSVDLSRKSLTRGEENFTLNGLPLDRHIFLADDVQEVLPRLGRRGEKFDAIVLDPPTFSRGNKGKKFQVEDHLESLVVAALEVAAPRAAILVSTNCARLEKRALETMARFALKTGRRSASFHQEPPLPDVPADQAARTLWLLLG
jgi:23S rRNA (cytosine1962-C5)-methyltransferase